MYQDDSTKVSKVSVSRRAGLPQRGQSVRTNSSHSASGLAPPVGVRSSGSTTGSSSSGTGTAPQSSQWTTGIGAPQ